MSGKLTPKLGYNLSIDAYWMQLSAANLGLAQARSSATGFARASLNWQANAKDLLQLNLFSTAKRLLPQGYVAPGYSGSIGYRHVISSKASLMVVADDPFHTQRSRYVSTIDGVLNRQLKVQASQSISLAFVWNFAGKPKEADFDFGGGGR